jgi:hypothetical protein
MTAACHIDARMVHNALYSFNVDALDLLFIENAGNLVCPAEFYLGKDLRVMVYSNDDLLSMQLRLETAQSGRRIAINECEEV